MRQKEERTTRKEVRKENQIRGARKTWKMDKKEKVLRSGDRARERHN